MGTARSRNIEKMNSTGGDDKGQTANPEKVVAAQQKKRGSPKSREEDQYGKEMAAEFH